jgi:uncharacterized protein YxjI
MSYQQGAGGPWPAPTQQPAYQGQQQAQQAPQAPPAQPAQPAHPPAWYPDPFGRHESRWWDGHQWTEHVASHGRQSVDAPVGGSPIPAEDMLATRTDRIQGDVQSVGGAAAPQGGGTLFTEPVLVVNQKAKLIEVNNEYAIYNQHGQQIGAIRQVGQSMAKKAIRVLTNYDQFLTHKFQIVDAWGNVQLAVTRPAKVLKSRFVVQDAMGNEIGQIAQQNVMAFKIRFNLESGGRTWGTLNAQDWASWNFSIQDYTGAEIARVSKTWEGFAKALFTTADNYVIQIHRPLEDPLRSLVVASALSVDTALRQDEY